MSETSDTDELITQIDNIIHESPRGSSTQGGPNLTIREAPEKELTLFAVRLAIMEKLASGIGMLACTWASVIILGGFAIVMSPLDFWFVTTILVIEYARIYSRSGEIEWQYQSTWTFANGPRGNFRLPHRGNAVSEPTSATQADRPVEGREQMHALGQVGSTSRTWNVREVPLISFWGLDFLLKNIGKVLIWLQVSFALVSMALSLHQLIRQNFGEAEAFGYYEMNRDVALNLYYSLALANDLLFLMEKIYWCWKINVAKLLEGVSKKCEFRSSKATTDLLKHFFYDVYAECINDSIFGGLKKDLVTYAEKLLGSEEPDKNLMGAQILSLFVNHGQFAFDTIHKVGTSGKTMERLVEMLGWKIKADKEVRMLAAQVVSKISGKRKGSIGIAKIPGSLEAIASLLNTGNHDNKSGHEFNHLGLLILTNLSSDHQNCEKIMKSPGLISKIIEFTDTTPNLQIIEPTGTSPNLLLDEQQINSRIMLVTQALKVVLSLASSKGETGNALRQQISRNVFIAGYIRKILKHGQTHKIIQKISIQILTFLAMDEEATERIASTGGVINLLLKIFFEPRVSEETSVSVEAGEALSMLTIKSQKSCNMILQESNFLVQLAEMVKEKLQGPYACRILRNVCVYATPHEKGRLDATIKKTFPIVLERTIREKGKLLEVSVGFLVALCKLMGPTKFHEELAQARSDLNSIVLVQRLIDILKEYKYPGIKVPEMRRFVIELLIWMFNASDGQLELFKNSDMKSMLESVAETTTELENFHHFSGSVGICQHSDTIADLLGEASALLRSSPGSSTSVQDNN